MDFLANFVPLTAHAYLVRGAVGETCSLLRQAVSDGHFGTVTLADQFIREYESLSVDDVRDEIAPFAHFKPLGDKKIIIIGAEALLPAAQNALLKITEEGSGKSVFFFVVEPGVPILSTLESRCVVIKQETGTISFQSGKKFLAMSYKERLALAEKFTKDHDREGARELVRSLVSLVSKQKTNPEILRDLLEAQQFLTLTGSSPKAIIGHLALVL